MRFALCTVIGIALAVVGVALVTDGVYTLTRVTACASTAIATFGTSCLDTPGADVGRLVGGFFASMAGIGVFAARGGLLPSTGGFGGAVWGMLMLGTAAAVWMAGHGDGAFPGVRDATLWTAVGIGAFGGLILLFSIHRAFAPRRLPAGLEEAAQAGRASLAQALAQLKQARTGGQAGGMSAGADEPDGPTFASDDPNRRD